MYPQDTVNFYVRSGSTSAVGLNLYASNATRGYVYANSSNDVGFLNNGGTWRLRIVGGNGVDINGSYLQLSNSDGYIKGGSITTRSGSRAIHMGYSGTCIFQGERTDGSSSAFIIAASSNQTYFYSRVSGGSSVGRRFLFMHG